jgi:DNA polymerase phi
VQFLEFVPHLRERLISMLSSAAQDNSSNAAHVKDILKIASQAARQNKRLSEAETLVTLWTPDAWETLRSQLASSERFKSSTALHNSCKQIIEMTSLSSSASKTVSPGGNPAAIGSILDDLSTQDAKQVTKPKKRKAESGSEKQGDDEQEKTKRKKTKKAA